MSAAVPLLGAPAAPRRVDGVPAAPRRVDVAVALPVTGSFTYSVPPELDLVLGHAVLVPFGRRKVTGYVLGPGDDQVPANKLRAVDRLLDPVPAFDEGQLAFFRWIAGYYLASLGEVIATALPSGLKAHSRRVVVPTAEGIAELAVPSLAPGPEVQVLREIVARPGLTPGGLVRRLHGELEEDQVRKALVALERARHVAHEERETGGTQAQVAVVRLVGDPAAPVRGARMRAVLDALDQAGGSLDLALLVGQEGPGARDAVRRLAELGRVERSQREDRRAAVQPELPGGGAAPRLHRAQQDAVAALTEARGARAFLLHGVTGSGKTEVYLHAAEQVLARGQQVLVLVPEISLTPQLTGRFRARFGEAVAVLHSGLGPGDRLREWRRIRAREAQVAVGARSALFAPFPDLGLVVVDEEHDDSYKQDDGVRYHARDLAVVRAWQAACPVVLGSATPSSESWQNAREGRYTLLRLPERATARTVPRIELVDMRGRPPASPLSDELVTALELALGRKGKAIILYNRRGYAPSVACPGCGNAYRCPSCGVALVYHRAGRAAHGPGGTLQCHHCGYHQPFRPDCPACGTDLEILGHGTARVEEALRERFPEVGLARMDADTTSERGAHHAILERFRTGGIQVLIGTQMVAKGHDFPDVHLAAVVGVDHLLMMPDFRSAERVHALVTQLAGRAGRGAVQGRVLVQTCQPEHFVFRTLTEEPVLPPPEDGEPTPAFALDPALDAFLVAETRQRRLLGHPPFTSLVLVRLEGTDADATRGAARELAGQLRTWTEAGVRIQGPVAAPLARLVGRWRYQLVIRAADRPGLRRFLHQASAALQQARGGVRIIVDIDPRSLL